MADFLPIFGVQAGGGYGQYGGNAELHGYFGALTPTAATLVISPSASVGLDVKEGSTHPYATAGGQATYLFATSAPIALGVGVGLEGGILGNGGAQFIAKPSAAFSVFFPTFPVLSLSAGYTPQIDTANGYSNGFTVAGLVSF